MQPDEAEAIVTDWNAYPPSLSVARRGLLLDTVLFIPLYSTLIAALRFWAAHVSTADGSTRAVFLAFAWCGWVAGAFDLIENAGILAETYGHNFVATPTASVALMKWGLALSDRSLQSDGCLSRSFCVDDFALTPPPGWYA